MGVPASKYNLCNVYGDYLGDWTQYHLQALLEYFDNDDMTVGTFSGRRQVMVPHLVRQSTLGKNQGQGEDEQHEEL